MPENVFCPRCRTTLRVMANKFYGTGLAVHKSIHFCPQCSWVGFEQREPDPDADPDDGNRRESSWLQRFAASLLGHVEK